MKIAIASDHRGVKQKKVLVEYLKKLGHEVEDFGTDGEESVDYPVYAFSVGEALREGRFERGILICGSGIGMSIAANKVPGVRCAKVDSVKDSKYARLHNDANCISFSADLHLFKTKDIVDMFLSTSFSNGERHVRRVSLINGFKG